VASPGWLIRPARAADLKRILDIYNHEVVHSTATYDMHPRSAAQQRDWFKHHGASHPVLVAERGGAVGGWASLSPWAERAAYDRSVETSVYVALESRGQGCGTILLAALIDRARTLGHHAVLARISADNEASVRLHQKAGFFVAGTLKEVGIKFGRMLDVVILELLL